MKYIKAWLNRNGLRLLMWLTDGVQTQLEEDAIVKISAHRFRSKKPYELNGTHLEMKKGHLLLWVEDWK